MRTQGAPTAGVHRPDGRVQSQRVPAQRCGQVQRASAARHKAIGSGNEDQKLRKAELASEVSSQETGVLMQPLL